MLTAFDHIITPVSAHWCGWVMLFLLFCAIISEWMQPGVISQAFSTLFAKSDRTYKEAPANTIGQLFVSIFRIGTLGMALCMCLYSQGAFSFVAYCAVCGLIVAVLLLKMLCNVILDSVFMLTKRFAAPYEHYANVSTIAILVLYPLLLVLRLFGTPLVNIWVLGIVSALFVSMWLYRSARIFVTSPTALGYLLLYSSTLEVLPLVLLFVLSEKMISIL